MKPKALKKFEIRKFNKEVIKIVLAAGYVKTSEYSHEDFVFNKFEKTNDWGFKHTININEVQFPITYFEINTHVSKNGIIEKDNICSVDYDHAINKLKDLIEFANEIDSNNEKHINSILVSINRIAVRTNRFTTEHYKDFYIGAIHISNFGFEGCPAEIRETVYEEILKMEKSY